VVWTSISQWRFQILSKPEKIRMEEGDSLFRTMKSTQSLEEDNSLVCQSLMSQEMLLTLYLLHKQIKNLTLLNSISTCQHGHLVRLVLESTSQIHSLQAKVILKSSQQWKTHHSCTKIWRRATWSKEGLSYQSFSTISTKGSQWATTSWRCNNCNKSIGWNHPDPSRS